MIFTVNARRVPAGIRDTQIAVADITIRIHRVRIVAVAVAAVRRALINILI